MSRAPLPIEKKRVLLTMYVDPQTNHRIRVLAKEQKISMGNVVDRALGVKNE